VNVPGDVLNVPAPSTKKPGSVVTFLNNPRTLSNENTFQDLGNCRDGLCLGAVNRCNLDLDCNCGGFCEKTAADCRARVPAHLSEAIKDLYFNQCQANLDAAQQDLDTFNAIPPQWSSTFTQKTITIDSGSGIVNANIAGCSLINDNCLTVSTSDKSLALITDGQEWYFANFPRGFV
jgi:hypothetical protein